MKNKLKIFIILALLFTGCLGIYTYVSFSTKESNEYLIPTIDKVRGIAELATLETKYHDVAKFNKSDTKLFFIKNNKVLWIEYTGTLKIGTDVSKMEMDVKGDDIKIKIPPSKILENGCKVDPESLNAKRFHSKEEGLLVDKINADDEKAALSAAKKSMEKEAKENRILFVQADERAKELIRNYIENVGKVNNKKYNVSFEYTDN